MGRERQLWHRRIKQHLVIQLVTATIHTFVGSTIKALRHRFSCHYPIQAQSMLSTSKTKPLQYTAY